MNFNPRSPSGLRPCSCFNCVASCIFQSTQPEWAATAFSERRNGYFVFQSTQPEWAATWYTINSKKCVVFQSTQPEWAATLSACRGQHFKKNFNPRSPSGLRPARSAMIFLSILFQSTQPEWAATCGRRNSITLRHPISIHAARVGCDYN